MSHTPSWELPHTIDQPEAVSTSMQDMSVYEEFSAWVENPAGYDTAPQVNILLCLYHVTVLSSIKA